jgi:hypothetical protein
MNKSASSIWFHQSHIDWRRLILNASFGLTLSLLKFTQMGTPQTASFLAHLGRVYYYIVICRASVVNSCMARFVAAGATFRKFVICVHVPLDRLPLHVMCQCDLIPGLAPR